MVDEPTGEQRPVVYLAEDTTQIRSAAGRASVVIGGVMAGVSSLILLASAQALGGREVLATVVLLAIVGTGLYVGGRFVSGRSGPQDPSGRRLGLTGSLGLLALVCVSPLLGTLAGLGTASARPDGTWIGVAMGTLLMGWTRGRQNRHE